MRAAGTGAYSRPRGGQEAARLPFHSGAKIAADSRISSFVHLRFYFQCLQRYIFRIEFNIFVSRISVFRYTLC